MNLWITISRPVTAIAVGGLLALGGCHEKEPPAAEERRPPVTVEVAQVGTIAPRITVAGVLSPLPGRDVKVGALVSGRVDRVLVAEGDRVRPGQPLAHVEAQMLKEHVVEVDAQKEQARAQLENARVKLRRSETLWKDGISSKQEVEDARAQLVAAASAVKQASAAGGTATVQLDRATLRSPIAGIVAAVLVPAGQPVEGNGTPVIEVADTRLLDLRAPISAARIGEVVIGQKAELDVEGAGGVVGVVQAIAPLVDTTTNTVMVRVRVDNAAGRLRGGMFARGFLVGAARSAITIPRAALLPGDGGAATQVAVLEKDDVIAHRAVVLGVEAGGGQSGDRVEVRSGLAAGDRVVVAGGYTLPDGAHVAVEGSAKVDGGTK